MTRSNVWKEDKATLRPKSKFEIKLWSLTMVINDVLFVKDFGPTNMTCFV